MKKLTVILLLAIYAISISGIGIRKFYCCGKLRSTTIGFQKQFKGNCPAAGKMKGCCKTKFYTLEVKDKHQKSEAYFDAFNLQASDPILLPAAQPLALISQQPILFGATHDPPPGHSRCILFANLRL